MMAEDGVLPVILPEARRLDRLRRMVELEPDPDPLRRLAALVEVDAAGAAAVAERLRFSNIWRDRLRGLAPPWSFDPQGDAAGQRRTLYRLGAERYRDIALLQAGEGSIGRDRLAQLLALADDWTPPDFPLSGHDVMALGIPPGPRVGALLDTVERWWEAAGFAPDRAQCLAHMIELTSRL